MRIGREERKQFRGLSGERESLYPDGDPRCLQPAQLVSDLAGRSTEGSCQTSEVLLVMWSAVDHPCYEAVELFSGVGRIAQRYRMSGMPSAEYDIIHDSSMDFLSPGGFARLGFNWTSCCVNRILLKSGAAKASDLRSPPPVREWTFSYGA